jgi:hypothetical protein
MGVLRVLRESGKSLAERKGRAGPLLRERLARMRDLNFTLPTSGTSSFQDSSDLAPP